MGAAPRSISLKGRALRLLSQREHSRLELTQKLTPQAESQAQLESVLDGLEQSGLLSAQRFAQSLAHRRSARFGLRRIEHEMQLHRLDVSVSAPILQDLRDSERDRAMLAWSKRFDGPASDVGERARQHRFLAQRGFTADAIAWVMRTASRTEGIRDPDIS